MNTHRRFKSLCGYVLRTYLFRDLEGKTQQPYSRSTCVFEYQEVENVIK